MVIRQHKIPFTASIMHWEQTSACLPCLPFSLILRLYIHRGIFLARILAALEHLALGLPLTYIGYSGATTQ
jgi:hypothetical protein